MNWRKNIVLVVGGGVALALFIVALVVLLKLQGRYRTVHGELTSAKSRLDALHRRDPFPSQENIAIVHTNQAALSDYMEELRNSLLKEQLETEQIETAEFAPLLEKTSRRLMQRAAVGGVKLPDRFAMGFDRYAAGALPSHGAIPRLVVQLKTVDVICNLLVDARVSEIVNVERTAFEGGVVEETDAEAVPVFTRRRSQQAAAERAPVDTEVPMAETNELYGVERIKVSFTARDASVWEVLNALARVRAFVTVVDVKIENTIPTTVFTERKPPSAPQAGMAVVVHPTHEERVVSGREPIRVDLVLDVYRFPRGPRKEAGT
jgi:hypothetical protein